MAVKRYNGALVAIHWLVAVLVIMSLAFGMLVLADMPNDAAKVSPLQVHFVIGVTILLLMLARIVLRFTTAKPEPALTGNKLFDRLRSTTHFLFYVLVLAMVSTGLGMAFLSGLPEVLFGATGASMPESFAEYPPRDGHGLFSKILLGLIALHFVAALYHQFVIKDGLLSRMWFGSKD